MQIFVVSLARGVLAGPLLLEIIEGRLQLILVLLQQFLSFIVDLSPNVLAALTVGGLKLDVLEHHELVAVLVELSHELLVDLGESEL